MTNYYEDDPGAPSHDAYTAEEKRCRAKSQQVLLISPVLILIALLIWWFI